MKPLKFITSRETQEYSRNDIIYGGYLLYRHLYSDHDSSKETTVAICHKNTPTLSTNDVIPRVQGATLQHQIIPDEDTGPKCRNVGSCMQFDRVCIYLKIIRVASKT